MTGLVRYASLRKAFRIQIGPRKMSALYAVMGYPIGHSRSPEIHARFAAQTSLDLEYRRIEVRPGSLASAVENFRADGGRGCNVTVPLKEEAAELSDELGPEAGRAGAVNTLTLDAGGRMRGDNTDGTGLVRHLRTNLGVELAGARVLIIGAGGAVRGILPALLAEGAGETIVFNRTQERARELARRFNSLGAIRVAESGNPELPAVDLVINASSAGISGEPPGLDPVMARGALCMDLAYGRAAEPFLAWAREGAARAAHDGWGMLVEQAAESFRIWYGTHPDTTELLEP